MKQPKKTRGAGRAKGEVEITVRLPREEYEAAKRLCDSVRMSVEEMIRGEVGSWILSAKDDRDVLLNSLVDAVQTEIRGRSKGFQRAINWDKTFQRALN